MSVPMGSLFDTVFLTLFFNLNMVAKMVAKWVPPLEGTSTKISISPPLGLSPSHYYP